jgi:hypothetical protein
MFAHRFALSAFFALALTATASAGFTVSIGSTTVNSGGTSSVDVLIFGSPELLDFFVGEFRITPIGAAPASLLQFSAVQTDFSTNANYAFLGNSNGLIQTVTTTVSTGDTLTILDGTTTFAGVDLSSTHLLSRLDFNAASGLVSDAQYRIELVPGGSSFFDPDTNTLNASASSGIITVLGNGGLNAVSAPAGLVLLASGLVPGILVVRRLRRREWAPA